MISITHSVSYVGKQESFYEARAIILIRCKMNMVTYIQRSCQARCSSLVALSALAVLVTLVCKCLPCQLPPHFDGSLDGRVMRCAGADRWSLLSGLK